MPLSPSSPRTLRHTRRVVYHGYERADGLWDIEGELHDSKPHETRSLSHDGPRPAGTPIHHMAIRATVDGQLVVQAIEVAMAAFPLHECPKARPALQNMVGCSMARGWRQSIQTHLGGVAGCTHLRELLFNMATAAFQTMSSVFINSDPDVPPRHLGQCKGWDFHGAGVQEHYPQFYGRDLPAAGKAVSRKP